MRLTLLPKVLEQPVGPIRDLSSIALVGLVASLVVVPVMFGPLLVRRSGDSRLRAVFDSVPWSLLRWLAVAVLLVRALASTASQGSDADSAGQVIAQLVAATLLVVPDVIRLMVGALSTNSARGLLVKRFMQADRARFAIMGFLVAVSIAAPTAASTFVATSTRTEAAANLSQVPSGQLWVDMSEGKPAVRASRVVKREFGSRPVSVGATNAFTEGNLDSVGSVQMGIKTVDTSDDLELLLGSALTPHQADVLSSGGVLLISGSTENRTVQVQSGTADPEELPVQFENVEGVAEELQGVSAGFILTSAAHDLDLTVTPSLDIYGGLSDDEIRDAVAQVRQGGRDTHSLQYHVIPQPTKPTREWYTALVGLLSVAALVLGALMAGHASHLREYGGRLVTLGLRRRWTVTVGLFEFGVIALTAGLAALAASVSAIAILATTTQERLILDIPWGFISVGIASALAVCLAVLTLALRPRKAGLSG